MPRKICPLCGDDFDSSEERCPADGRLLVAEKASGGGASGVRLSRETERLLGNILEDDDETVPIDPKEIPRKVPSEDAAEATLIGPPPSMPDPLGELLAPGEEESLTTEATVTTGLHLPEALSLPKPLASLKPPEEPADELDDHLTDDLTEDLAHDLTDESEIDDDQDTGVAPAIGAGRAGARVFEDLQMEAAQLNLGEVNDNDVTRRMAREDVPREEHTRRSEMPPEFAEALALEEADAQLDIEPGPSDKVEIDSTLEAEADRLEAIAEALKPPPKPQRKVPTPSQLIVRQAVITLRRTRPTFWPYALGLLVVVVVAVILVIVL